MPFTISHAAAVLPLKKSPLPLAALMIGSMSPDFSYFLPISLANTSWHNLRRGEPRASNPREARKQLTDRARVAALGILSMTSAVTALLSYASCAGARFEYRIFELLIGGMTGGALAWTCIALLIGRLQRLDHQ